MCWAELLTGVELLGRDDIKEGESSAGRTGTVLGKPYRRRAVLRRPFTLASGSAGLDTRVARHLRRWAEVC